MNKITVMGKNPSSYDEIDRAKHPVERVSWNDAMEFCKLLNAAFRKEMDGYVFTLPTDAQWETAAYAGEKTRYSGSDNLDEVGWYDENSNGHTHVVGMKKPNAWGFHDMSGNVDEWCLDADGSCRATRGGSWDFARGCRVDCRISFSPGLRGDDVGIRIAASVH